MKQLELLITPPPGTSSATLLEQATQFAQQQASFVFSQQPEVTHLKLYLSASYAGQLVPIFLATVDRRSWQTQPDIRLYRQSSDAGVMLLGLERTGRSTLAARPPHLSMVRQPHRDDIAFRDD